MSGAGYVLPVGPSAPRHVLNWDMSNWLAGVEFLEGWSTWDKSIGGGTRVIYAEETYMRDYSPEMLASLGFHGEAFEKWMMIMVHDGFMSEETRLAFLHVDEWGVELGHGAIGI